MINELQGGNLFGRLLNGLPKLWIFDGAQL